MRHLGSGWVLAACALAALGTLAGPASPPSETLDRIVRLALSESRAYEKLAYLSDRIGHRLSGSEALERAVDWTAAEFERDGLSNVRTESVMVPHWIRGEESARIVSPVERPMAILGLGGTVGTPAEGVTADVIQVDSFEALEAEGERARGKIVLFNLPIEPGWDADPGYGHGARLRARGPSAAARLGAVGMLIRSLGTADYRLPHTGALSYNDEDPRIPAAAISAEDADRIDRLIASGDTVRVRMDLGARQLADAESANVLAELPGRELPAEIVLIGAHLDTWDVGDGAHDDGSGCAVVMETMRLLARHGLQPRRTIRAVLFTNEENGLRGGKDYARRHADERHVVAIESDLGGAAPQGFGVTAGDGGVELIEGIAKHLAAIGADRVHPRGGGPDISPLRKQGVPVMGIRQDITRYFDYHHTVADTLDKVDRGELDRNVAAMATMAWALAEIDETLPRKQAETD